MGDLNQGHHNHLANELAEHITFDQFTKLLQCFRSAPFGNGELQKLDCFRKLWNELDTSNIIGIGNYDRLKNELISIRAQCHIDLIEEFEEKMKYKRRKTTGRTTYDTPVTKAKLLELIKKFRALMEEEGPLYFATEHVFDNALFGLISQSGSGNLRK